ncbi:Proliferation-associated protein 2G4 [Irineochytrium annulatum]|nr:Proliferation-associated protein 2G4 [Irineochytrium annulatum]
MDLDQLDADNRLTDHVVQKYQTSAAFANEAIRRVLSAAAPGVRIVQLCKAGDDYILEQTAKVFTTVERGIAFPTSVTGALDVYVVNEVAMNYSPLAHDDSAGTELKEGDVVKVELGVHIDGYISTLAHTTVLNPAPSVPITGPAADVIAAAHYAAESALRLIRYGGESSEVIDAVNKIAAGFGVKAVQGTSTRLMKRFLLEAEQEIPNGIATSDMESFLFADHEVYAINIVMSTGSGSLKPSTEKPTILQRDVQRTYNLKVKAARACFNDIQRNFGVFPFSMRALMDVDPHHRLGIAECVSKDVVLGRPTLTEINGSVVAHFKMTVLLLPGGPMRLTAPLNPPYIQSQYSIEGTPFAELLKTNIKVAKAKLPNASNANSSGMEVE